jgi:hypothetical protein
MSLYLALMCLLSVLFFLMRRKAYIIICLNTLCTTGTVWDSSFRSLLRDECKSEEVVRRSCHIEEVVRDAKLTAIGLDLDELNQTVVVEH